MAEAVHSLKRFLKRALAFLPSSIGSNHLGVWFPLVPTALFLFYEAHESGWKAMTRDLVVGLVITVISYGLLFLYCIAHNVYTEHIALVAKENETRQQLDWIQDIPPWQGFESEQVWRDAIEFQNKLITLGRSVDGLFSPLQIEAFTLAKELRGFYSYLGPYPPQSNGEAQDLVRYVEERGAWEHKLSHGYANRDFGTKVASIFHQVGEEYDLEYPQDMLSRSAEIGPSFTSYGILKLAQEMEMIAIWINRKHGNEVNLLS